MRKIATLFTLAFLAACGGGEDAAPAVDEAAPAETMESAQPMADFTGTWTLTANLEGTPDPVRVTIEGTADGTFIMTLPDRTP